METEEDLECWRARAFAGMVFSTKGTEGGPDFSAEVDAEFEDWDDDWYSVVPVKPKNRPPARNSRIALPEPED